jgi:hypothetical protein
MAPPCDTQQLLTFQEADIEEPPEEPLELVSTAPLLHIVAQGNHLSAFPWASWRCESITEAHQEDSPGLLAERQSSSPS